MGQWHTPFCTGYGRADCVLLLRFARYGLNRILRQSAHSLSELLLHINHQRRRGDSPRAVYVIKVST